MNYILLLLSFLIANITLAQSTSTLMGARQLGMANASSVTADEWSLWNNVGGIGKVKERAVAVAYEATPTLVGANRKALVATNPFGFGTLAVGAFRFGDNVYSEQLISIGFGNQVGITALGAKANIVQYRAEGFGTRTALSFDFGGITQITPLISIGAYITNLTQSSFSGSDNYRLPTRLTVGLGLKPTEKIFIATELEKDLDFKPTWRTGIEYTALKNFFIRTGFNFNPQNIYFGLGGKKKNITFDYALRYHQLLGTSHQISAAYFLTSKIKK
jgi:hypothetical protein